MATPAFLAGDTVSLRPVEEADAEFIYEAINSPEIWKTMRPTGPYSLQEIRSLSTADTDSSTVRFLVTVEAERVGVVGYSVEDERAGVAELSCWIHPSHSGEGYGTEAVNLLLEYGFDQCRLHKFVAEVVAFNGASKRLVEKVGFLEEGRQREQDFADGEYHDCLLYGLVASEWREDRG